MDFDLRDYFIAKIRDGGSTYKLEQIRKEEFDENNDFEIMYYHDVEKYYYFVPKIFKKEIGDELLKFFYKDNNDYTDDHLIEFKQKYPEFFEN